MFTKIGKEKRSFYDSNQKTTNLKYDAHFNEYGIALGSRFAFGLKGIIGLDVNIGIINSQHFIYSFQPDNQNPNYIYNYKDSFSKPT